MFYEAPTEQDILRSQGIQDNYRSPAAVSAVQLGLEYQIHGYAKRFVATYERGRDSMSEQLKVLRSAQTWVPRSFSRCSTPRPAR